MVKLGNNVYIYHHAALNPLSSRWVKTSVVKNEIIIEGCIHKHVIIII